MALTLTRRSAVIAVVRSGTLTSKPAMTASMSGASSAALSAKPVTVNWTR